MTIRNEEVVNDKEVLDFIHIFDLLTIDTKFKSHSRLCPGKFHIFNTTYLPKYEERRSTKPDYIILVSNRWTSKFSVTMSSKMGCKYKYVLFWPDLSPDRPVTVRYFRSESIPKILSSIPRILNHKKKGIPNKILSKIPDYCHWRLLETETDMKTSAVIDSNERNSTIDLHALKMVSFVKTIIMIFECVSLVGNGNHTSHICIHCWFKMLKSIFNVDWLTGTGPWISILNNNS